MTYSLGANSKKELQGVHPDLVKVVERAIQITAQDFTVFDGLRTADEQRNMVSSGASQTMNSMHRVQKDGFGHAVDLVPWINGKPRWEWEPIYTITHAVSIAAHELNVRVRWGGAWVELPLLKNPAEARRLVEAYGAARRKAGKKAFTDGPHFEIMV